MKKMKENAIRVCLLLFGGWRLCASDVMAEREFPNIVWMTIEDTSPYVFGCYGNDDAVTPHVDRLAEEGARYTNAFSTSPVCSTARTSLILGCPATTYGMDIHRYRWPKPDVEFFPQIMSRAGYYCTNNSKTDYNFKSDGGNLWNHPELWDASGQTASYNDSSRAEGQPFFSVFNLTLCHASRLRTFHTEGRPDFAREGLDPNEIELPGHIPDLPEIRSDYAMQLEGIQDVDTWVGLIRNDLEKRGLAEDTILFFYSDQPGVGGIGRNGSSGKAHDDGVPDGFDPSSTNFPSTKVELPPGMTDEAFISGVRNDPLLNSGIYLPFIDDCHSSAVRTAHRQGVEALQRPRGRIGSEIPPPNIRPPSRETDLPDLTICFVAGTQITMSDGTTNSIEDIQPGDSVQSWSEESKKLVTGRVLETFDPLHEDLVILDFGARVTKNTKDHPFFVKGKGWCSVSPRLTKSRYPAFSNVDIGQLEVGDECVLLKGSQLFSISLKSVFQTEGLVQTFNLNVDQTNTYFANGILVHNK